MGVLDDLAAKHEAENPPAKKMSKAEWKAARKKFVEDTGEFGTVVKEKVLDTARDAMPYVRPIAEGLGAGGGGFAGGALGSLAGGIGAIPGGVAGATLGYAATKNIMDQADVALGTTPAPTARQLLGTTANDLATGATMEMGGQVVGRAVGVAAPKVVDTYRRARAALSSGTPALTESGVREAAGRILQENTGNSPLYDTNAAAADQVAADVPGFRASLGEARNDPGLIKLQRGMERMNGSEAADLLAQKNAANRQALTRHLDEAFPAGASVDDTVSTIAALKAAAEGKTNSAVVNAFDSANKLQPVDPQSSGRGVIDVIEAKRIPAKKLINEQYEALPNDPIPTKNTASIVKELQSEFRPGDEEVFPTRAITRIKEALQGPKPKTGGFGKPEDPVILDAQGRPMRETVDPTKNQVGFQDLHSLRKDLGRQIQDASTGMNPNRELAMKLQKLKDAVDMDIELGMGASNDYTAAREAFSDYAKRYRTGEVDAILRRGNQASGRNIPDALISKRLATPDGADSFIGAVGQVKAAKAMQGHFADDLLAKVSDPRTGELNPKKLAAWVQKNGVVLDKYGIKGQFDTVNLAHNALDLAKQGEEAFGKTVAAKMLNADPGKAIAAAMSGAEGVSSKSTGQIMAKLLDQVKGNPAAVTGLQNGFKDFIIDLVETTQKTIAGDNAISPASIQKALAKYEPAMDVLYKDSPEQLAALRNIRDAVEIQGRSASSPLGGGSDTAEHQAIHKALGFILDKVPGVSVAAKLGKEGLTWLQGMNAKEVNALVAKALYDPELAKTLMMAAKGQAPKEVERRMASYLSHNVITAGAAGMAGNDQAQRE